MTRRLWRLGALSAFLLFMGARVADACSCMTSGPVCQAFWKTEAVFDATVDSIESAMGPEQDLGPRKQSFPEKRVKMTVRQALKGVTATGPLDVYTAEFSGACGYDFTPGQRYLVFASKRPADGRWVASLCSATQPYDGTGEAAAFIAALSKPPAGGRVFGSIRSFERLFDFDSNRERAIETRVRLSGAGQERSIQSTGGRFEFTGLDPGSYQLELDMPAGFHSYNGGRMPVDIPNARACAHQDFSLAPDGRINGRVLGPDGRALVEVRIEATPAEARPHPIYGRSTVSATSDGDGKFEIRDLPPGRYVVGVNLDDLPNQYNPYGRTMYPSDASAPQVIPLALGQKLDLGDWRMPPPLPVVQVEGVVHWQDGTPAAGVVVGAWDRTGNPIGDARGAGNTRTAADGRFVIELRRGRLYTLSVNEGSSGRAVIAVAAPRIDTSGPVGAVRIVVRGDRAPDTVQLIAVIPRDPR